MYPKGAKIVLHSWSKVHMQAYVDKPCIETAIESYARKKELFSKIKSIGNLLLLIVMLL